MTRVEVVSGICGFTTAITATLGGDGKTVSIELESTCEMVRKMGPEIASLQKMSVFTKFLANPVYKAANAHLTHTACPVPSGIIKAMEVEAGFCLPKDVSIRFLESAK